MFKNLKIRNKLFVAFGLVISMSMICGALFFVVINGTSQNFATFHEDAFGLSKETYTLKADINQLSNSICKAVMSPDKELAETYIQETKDEIAALNQRLTGLYARSFSDDFTALLDELKSQIDNIEKRSGKLFDLCKQLLTSSRLQLDHCAVFAEQREKGL